MAKSNQPHQMNSVSNPTSIVPWAAIVLTLAGMAAYANSWRVPFIYDDIPSTIDNPTIRRLWPIWECLVPPSKSDITVAGRPLANLSLAINYAISGTEVWSYHVINMLVHIGAALALFGVVRRTLRLEQFSRSIGSAADAMAMAVAMLWMLHPLQTSAVTYTVQRVESLMGLFLLLTMYCSIRSMTSPRRVRQWTAAAIIFCAAGMATKEVMVAAPLLVLLFDRTFVSDSCVHAMRRQWRLHLGLGATWIILAMVVMSSPRTSLFDAVHLSALEYAATQCKVMVHYLRMIIWPHPLVFDYGEAGYGVPIIQSFAQWLPWGLIVLALLLASGIALWMRHWLGFLGAWFFLILAPSSSIVPIPAEVMAEHRLYLPTIAVISMIVIGGYVVIKRLAARQNESAESSRQPERPLRMSAVMILIATAFVLGGMTMRRNHEYRTAESIWTDTIAKRPNNARAYNNLGLALEANGRAAEAVPHYRKAIELSPAFARAKLNLASIMFGMNELDEAERLYREAVSDAPSFAEAHYNYAVFLGSQSRIDECIAECRTALSLNPMDADTHCLLGYVLYMTGESENALSEIREALRLAPNHARAQSLLQGITAP